MNKGSSPETSDTSQTSDAADAPGACDIVARARVRRLTVVRFSGVALAMIGGAAIADRIDLPLPHLLGLLMVLGGAYYVLVFPLILARRWRSPRP